MQGRRVWSAALLSHQAVQRTSMRRAKLRNIVIIAHVARLRSVYRLGSIEPFRELPLDVVTARRLLDSDEGAGLPAWPGVNALTSEVSARYQEVATRIARARKVRRLHLDVYWWSLERDS